MSSMFLRRWVPGAMLLVAAGASCALTLGRAQGVALIGRPLDVSIQLGLDAPGEAAELCPEAEVFYGDNRVDARRVDLAVAPAGNAATVRLRVGTPIDEAFVQVYLRVGCNARLTRRYVLLTEQPPDIAEAALQPTPIAPFAAAPVPLPSAGPARSSAVGAPAALSPAVPAAAPIAPAPATAGAPAAAPAPRPAPRPAARPPAPVPAATAAGAGAGGAAQRPRLKLDALEVRPGTATVSGGSAAARSNPTAPAAAASVPPAPDAPSEDMLRQAERIQSLEADLKKLREGMLKSDAALSDLRSRLEKAEGERYANPLVYGLGALLAAALGAAFVFWRRSRAIAQPVQWWADPPERPPADPEPQLVEDPAAAPAVPAAASLRTPLFATPDLDGALAPVPTENGMVATTRSAPAGRGFTSTDTAGLRVSDPAPLTAEELSDIQQEADFFVSLGEYDRAIELLRNHIEAHPQASAVAWLDLLGIHHQLGRQEDYEQLRRDFEWLFNAKAPAFANFLQASEGVEAHPRLMARIQAAWPRREVLEVIDDAIFRRPGADAEEPLDLQSYRDLLFLHTIGSELVSAKPEPAPMPRSHVKPPSGMDIDIDLDALQGVPVAPGAQAAPVSVHSNLMDFDLDLEREFKVPPRA